MSISQIDRQIERKRERKKEMCVLKERDRELSKVLFVYLTEKPQFVVACLKKLCFFAQKGVPNP